MDFKSAYEKLLDGTATPEEAEFVRNELAKAKAARDVIDASSTGSIINETSDDEVKKAVRSFSLKNTLRAICISIVCLLVIAAATVGTIFGVSVTSANKSAKYTIDQACEIAVEYVKEKFNLTDARVVDKDKDLKIEVKLTKSYYIYEIEINDMNGFDYEVKISSIDGLISVVKDYD